MRIHVDMIRCQSQGECCFVAPDLFELGDDDVLRWAEEADDGRRDEVERAVQMCPVQAISLQD
jgi:ferredoxin